MYVGPSGKVGARAAGRALGGCLGVFLGSGEGLSRDDQFRGLLPYGIEAVSCLILY